MRVHVHMHNGNLNLTSPLAEVVAALLSAIISSSLQPPDLQGSFLYVLHLQHQLPSGLGAAGGTGRVGEVHISHH